MKRKRNRKIRRKTSHIRLVAILALWVLLAGCGTTQATPTVAGDGFSQPKQLATVFISATPNDAERQATRFASTPTVNPESLVTPSPSPTVYIGVFLGDSAISAPVVNAETAGVARPTPTPVANRCLIEAETETLGTRWQLVPAINRGLGCAIEGLLPFEGRTQLFENGVMFTRDIGQTWAIAVGEPGEFWFVEQPPDAPSIEVNAPTGLLVPDGNFGALWRSRPEVQQDMGFAVLPDIPLSMGFQRFEGGILLWDNETGSVYALLTDGQAYGPFSP